MVRKAAVIVGVVMLVSGLAVASQTVAGAASAVYHEGVVTFQVNHADAMSIQVVVFDAATDGILFDSGATRGSRIQWAAGRVGGDVLRYSVKAWDGDGRLVLSQNATTKGVNEITSISFDSIPAGVTVKGGSDPVRVEGDLDIGPSAGQQRVRLENGASGGDVWTYDNTGGSPISMSHLGRSNNGGGGFVGLNGTTIFTGFSVDGVGPSNGGEPIMTIVGGSSSATFDTGTTGDSSVQLPASSVSAAEIGNEAGIVGWNSSTTNTTLESTLGIIVAQTITAPTAGFVVVVAECTVGLNHVNGTATTVELGISLDQSTLPSDQDKWIQVPNGAGTGTYYQSGSAIYTGAVTAGSHTFTLMAKEASDGQAVVHERNIAVMFFPTAYGSVSGSKAAATSDEDKRQGYDINEGWTLEDLEAERQMSIAANQQRMADEMVAMQRRLDEMQAELKANGGAAGH